MRKLLIAAIAAIAVLAVAGVALAANVYTVDGSTSGGGKGSKSKPVATKVNFDFQVESDNPAERGTPIEKFAIGSEGLVTYPELFPTCTFSQANRDGSVAPACKKAKVGSGLVQNVVGPAVSPTVKLFCNLKLGLYNVSGLGKNGGMAIRLDGEDDPSVVLSGPDDKRIDCPTAVHGAIRAKFVPTKIAGLPADDLRFTVPPELLHPSGLDTTVRNTVNTVLKKSAKKKIKGKSRKVGFYSKIGCKGSTRTVQATFTDEQGDVVKATNTGKC
jgi:hypothetical protein